MEFAGQNRPGPHLDIGCSIGNIVSTDPERIEGADVDSSALKICKERGLKCQYFDIVRDEVIAEEKYEVIYLRHVIEHFAEPLKVMIKIKKMLKTGGLLVVETPDYLIARDRQRKNFWDDYTHVRPFTFNALGRLAVDSGFNIVLRSYKPKFFYLTKVLLQKKWISLKGALNLHQLLRRNTGDLLFVFQKTKESSMNG